MEENQNSEELSREEQNSNEFSREERLNNFMFGTRRDIDQSEHTEVSESNQSTIDYEQLMIHIDTLMESAKSLKPLFQKVYPFIGKIWQKK
jgi:hypothetical protein